MGMFEVNEIVSVDDYSITVSAVDLGALAGRRTHLKVLKDGISDDADLATRMRDEARVLSRLHHPGMVHLFHLHSFRGRPVLEMEYLRGVSAANLLDSARGGLPAETVVKIGRTVAGALDAAYNRPVGPGESPMRIIHRNVSLPNILVTIGGAVKVVDFIMAKGSFTDRLAISFVAPATTRGYPAPELADNAARPSPAGDVYSLGHCLFHLLTGTRINLLALEVQHEHDVNEAFVDFSVPELPGDLSARLVALIRRMIAFHPDHRPTHREVHAELSELSVHAQYPADLARFGEQVVTPLYERREHIPKTLHPAWHEVAFLETLLPDIPETEGGEVTPAGAEAKMVSIVRSSGWASRLGELQDLVVASGYRPHEPFLPTLDRALKPAWRFWERAAEPPDICAALAMVVQSGSPEVLSRARALREHKDPDVRKAATFVVSQYEDT